MRRGEPGWAIAGALVVCIAACREEPSRLCERIRLVWPMFNIDPSQDSSPAEGLQIDFALRTSLLPGSTGTLTVQGAEGDPVEHPQRAVADEEGTLEFAAVTVPFGRIALRVAVDSECGDAQSSRTPYVWDGLGFPVCDIDIGAEPAAVEELAPLGVVRAEHDLDPAAAGAQLQVSVRAGRPDMIVTLFALDVASGAQEVVQEESGGDSIAVFPVSLGHGEQAMRAVCVWEPADLRPSSRTLRLWVDAEVPDCELVAPTGRVRLADDLDPDRPGVQFQVLGRSGADDVAGRPAQFTVDGEEIEGSPVDETGESSATATLFVVPGQVQEISFRTGDLAGNECSDSVSFE